MMGSPMIIKVRCEHKKFVDVKKLFSKEGYRFVHSYYEDCNQCIHKNKGHKCCDNCIDEIYYTAWRGYGELPELISNNMDLVVDVWWIDLACTEHKKGVNTKEKWYSIKKELKDGGN